VEPAQLVAVDRLSRAPLVKARAPECLVDIDVPHAGERALVEERRLDRRAPLGQAVAEACSREERVEGLVAQPRMEVRLELTGLEEEPRAETADVAIADIRSVV